MQIDYKFWYIKRDDDGIITECAVRFYEGDVTTANDNAGFGESKSVTRYRRTRRLSKIDLPAQAGVLFRTDTNDNAVAIYTGSDFGVITDIDELILFLNKEIAKDTTRTPNDTQKGVVLLELKKQEIR